MITIPEIARDVPGAYTFRSSADTRIARLAQILEELGILTLDHAPRARPSKPWPHESTMIESAIAAWSENLTGGPLTVFRDVYLTVSASTVEDYKDRLNYLGDNDAAAAIDADDSVIFVLAPWDVGDCWLLRRRCEAIEKACPGLAETALDRLHFAVNRTVQSLLPNGALEFGEMIYGWGMCEDGEEERLSLKTFSDCFPPWVLREKRRIIRARIEELAARNEVARAIRDLDEAIHDPRALLMHASVYPIASFGLVLRWDESDPLTQVADDFCNDAINGGEATQDYGVAAVRLDTGSVRDFLDRFGRTLRTLACADRLVTLIAEPQQ